MFDIENRDVKHLLLNGEFGIERENLRITEQGFMACTPHPFPDDEFIIRDFCENQTEINTPVAGSAQEAISLLEGLDARIQRQLASMNPPEFLWQFSNPPYIRSDRDISIASFDGEQKGKTAYREYLSEKYGKYKMTFCGIHVNFSFAEELLKAGFKVSDVEDFRLYKNHVYLDLGAKLLKYGWLLTAVTAASPVLDSSFVEVGMAGRDVFQGLASVRCSELGYWNFFTPVLDYSSVEAYARSIKGYVEDGTIATPGELYYPVRLKPRGNNTLENLIENGINHIELRMVDLNPLVSSGLEVKDVAFAQLLIVWLASLPDIKIDRNDQINAAANFKSAAHYDFNRAAIIISDGVSCSVTNAARDIIDAMKSFFQDFPGNVLKILDFEEEKFINPQKRYAYQVKEIYGKDFVKKGIMLARQRQRETLLEN